MSVYKKQNPERFATIPTVTTSIGGTSGAEVGGINNVMIDLPGALYGYDGASTYPALAKIDDTHALLTYRQVTTTDCAASVLALNTATGAITEPGSVLTVDAAEGSWNAICQMDATHFFNIYMGSVSDCYGIILAVNTSTWAVTIPDATFEIKDAITNYGNACIKIDATHVLAIYSDSVSSDLFAQVLAVNTTTWAVSSAGAEYTINASIDGTTTQYPSVKQVDSNHFIVTSTTSTDTGIVTILEVNLSTWAVTEPSGEYTFAAAGGGEVALTSIEQVENDEYLIVYERGGAGTIGLHGVVVHVNTGTWAITETEAETTLISGNVGGVSKSTLSKITDTYYLVSLTIGSAIAANSNFSSAIVYVNPTTYAISATNFLVKNWSSTGVGSVTGQHNTVKLSNQWMITMASQANALAVQTIY